MIRLAVDSKAALIQAAALEAVVRVVASSVFLVESASVKNRDGQVSIAIRRSATNTPIAASQTTLTERSFSS
jgi:hypothetical protein